jgi:hypothetical protein
MNKAIVQEKKGKKKSGNAPQWGAGHKDDRWSQHLNSTGPVLDSPVEALHRDRNVHF